jgi:hypothetical protein
MEMDRGVAATATAGWKAHSQTRPDHRLDQTNKPTTLKHSNTSTTHTGLPEFEFHRFALSDVYNFFF